MKAKFARDESASPSATAAAIFHATLRNRSSPSVKSST